jgi:hypothetical protein
MSGRTRSEKFFESEEGFESEVPGGEFIEVVVDVDDESRPKVKEASFRILSNSTEETSLWLDEESSTTKEFCEDIVFVAV